MAIGIFHQKLCDRNQLRFLDGNQNNRDVTARLQGAIAVGAKRRMGFEPKMPNFK